MGWGVGKPGGLSLVCGCSLLVGFRLSLADGLRGATASGGGHRCADPAPSGRRPEGPREAAGCDGVGRRTRPLRGLKQLRPFGRLRRPNPAAARRLAARPHAARCPPPDAVVRDGGSIRRWREDVRRGTDIADVLWGLPAYVEVGPRLSASLPSGRRAPTGPHRLAQVSGGGTSAAGRRSGRSCLSPEGASSSPDPPDTCASRGPRAQPGVRPSEEATARRQRRRAPPPESEAPAQLTQALR